MKISKSITLLNFHSAQHPSLSHCNDFCAASNLFIFVFFSEICLKILAHNNLIGRIIGKGGNTIKRIMQDTDTKITVSSINDISSFNLERIITVKGSIENMAKAESLISAKLRQSYENDLQVPTHF